MQGLGGMQMKGGGAQAGQRGRQLGGDVAGLAHAGQDHAALAAGDQVQNLHKSFVQRIPGAAQRLDLHVKNAAGIGQFFGIVHGILLSAPRGRPA